jgi:hypothetical protein
MRRFLSGVCAGLTVTGAAVADHPHPTAPVVAPFAAPLGVPCPPVPCPPGSTVIHPSPGVAAPIVPDGTATPGMTAPAITPDLTGTGPSVVPTPVDLGGGGQFAAQTERGGGAAASYNANMFGDILGARALRIGYTATAHARFGFDPLNPGLVATQNGQGRTIDPNAPGGSIVFTAGNRTTTVNAAFNGNDLRYVQTLLAGNADFDRAFARSALQTLLSRGELSTDQINSLNQLTPAQRAQLLSRRGQINSVLTQATRGLAVNTLTVTGVDGQLGNGFIDYTATLSGETIVALPGTSGVVGRLKMSEDNSPIPRDRVIFTYDTFGDVPFTADGITVNRFQFGAEKTFLDGLYSFEFRLPFAGTLASTYYQGAEVTAAEFGNVRLALKRLVVRNQVWNVAGGLGITLPTAKDQMVFSALDDSVLYRLQNQSVQLEPFVGALFTPNDRLFAQAWTSVNFDASGSNLYWNRAVFGGSGNERIWDLPYLAVDGQVGYWLVKNDCGRLRALAPFVELHWNKALAQRLLVDAVGDAAAGNGLRIQGIADQELNMTAGLITQIGDNLNLSVGASVPLFQRPDRTFDWQFGVRASYLYGRTARMRNPATYVSNY